MNVMSNPVVEREEYWSSFYRTKSSDDRLTPPSQFAAFVAPELEAGSTVFDVGCGNGRDSLFFAELGFNVIALDASESAISFVKNRASARGLTNLRCLRDSITSPLLAQAITGLNGLPGCVYARFFLHAITHDEQNHFFKTLSRTMQSDQLLAFEYRTTADQRLEKMAPPHFRRYQQAADVNAQLRDMGFEPLYAIEGQGFAKYRTEDAVVARCIFRKV